MTDVYIACASDDLDRVRSIVHGLRGEGWNVVCDPHAAELSGENEDPRSVSAGAVIVTWTSASRVSARVRAEASNALYKNKLIQIRMDEHAPPRPFDQVDSVDLSSWWGWPEDAGWRTVVNAVRLFAGPPGVAKERPQVLRKPGTIRTAPAAAYAEPDRSPGPGAYAAAAAMVVAVVGAAAYFMLPNGFGQGSAEEDTAVNSDQRTLEMGSAVLAEATSPGLEAAQVAWETVDRRDPKALRLIALEYPNTDPGEQARALLRVMDSQTWVAAVSIDTEAGYRDYLAAYPAGGDMPGAMAKEAKQRLSELGLEREQAILDVQKVLLSANLYSGEADGRPTARTIEAVRTFASNAKIAAPDLVTAAPRDIRAFSDVIARQTGGAETLVAAAPTTAEITAAAADQRRMEEAMRAQADAVRAQAQADALAAATAAAAAAASTEADQTARLEADEAAWQQARGANTLAAYRAYLTSFPAGLHADAARNAATPAPFSLDALAPEIRTVAANARQAQTRAQARASAAREAAQRANAAAQAAREGSATARIVTAPDGDRFEAEVNGAEVSGVGIRIDANEVSRGDTYRGELRGGLSQGVGVYEFAENPNNAAAGALRYEGEHAVDVATGFGVTLWKNGNRFAGEDTGEGARGVLTYADGRRYEGQLLNGAQNGLGAVWSVGGEVLMAGRWENGRLVEPLMIPPLP